MTDSGIHRRIASGRWEKILPRVFRIEGAPETWLQMQTAAGLWAGDEAAWSHRAAAAAWELDGFPSGVIELTSPRNLRTPLPKIHVHRAPLPGVDVNTKGCAKVTSPWRTLTDLGAVASRDDVELALESALRRGLVSIPYLRKTLNRVGGKGRNGVGVLRGLLNERSDDHVPTGSAFEVKLRRLIVRFRLPMPIPQYVIRIGGQIFRPDFAYPEKRVAIEAQSRRWHDGRRYSARDYVRHNALTLAGWVVLYFTWEQVCYQPEEVAAEIASALGITTLSF